MSKILLVLFIILNTNCVSLPDKPSENEIAGRYYLVKKGDTLAKIAQKYRMSLDDIMLTNGLENVRNLKVGRYLFIPTLDPIGLTIAKIQKKSPPKKSAPISQAKSKIFFDYPLPGRKIFKSFSRAKLDPYDGIGISAPLGTPVLSAGNGKVMFVGDDGTKFGLLILVEHQEPFITVYTHLQKALVKTGDRVKRLMPIGQVGTSGGVKTPRLHFQIRVNQRPEDPKIYLKGR